MQAYCHRPPCRPSVWASWSNRETVIRTLALTEPRTAEPPPDYENQIREAEAHSANCNGVTAKIYAQVIEATFTIENVNG